MRALLGNVSRLTDSSSCASSRSSSRDRSPSARYSSSSCSSCSSSSSSSSTSSRTSSRALTSDRQRPQPPTPIGYCCNPNPAKSQRFQRPNSDACREDKSFKRTVATGARDARKRKKSVAGRGNDNEAEWKKNTPAKGDHEEHEDGELWDDDDGPDGKEGAPAMKKRKPTMWIQSETVSDGRLAPASLTTPTPTEKEKRSGANAGGGGASSHLASSIHVVSSVKNRPTAAPPSTASRPPFPPRKIPLLPRKPPVSTNGMDKVGAARNSRDAGDWVCGEFGVDDKKWIDRCDRGGAGSSAPHHLRRHQGALKFCNERVFPGLGGAMLRGGMCVRDALKSMFRSPIYYVEHLQKYVRWLENECRKQLLDVVVTNEVDGHIVDDAIAVVSAIIELVCFLLHVASRKQRQWMIACRGMTTYSCFPPKPPPPFAGYASGASTPSSMTSAVVEELGAPVPGQNSSRVDEQHRFPFMPAHFYTPEDITCYELDRCDAKMFLDFVVEPWACVVAGKIPALSHLPLVGGRQPISAVSGGRRPGGTDDSRSQISRPNMYGLQHHHQAFRVPRPHPPPHHHPHHPPAAATATAAPQPTHQSHHHGNVGATVASWNGNRRFLYRGGTRRC